MAKNQHSVYITKASSDWIERFGPESTRSGSIGFAAEWAINQFRRGAVSAHQILDADERLALVSVMLNYTPGINTTNIAMLVEDWFLMDTGAMLEWPQGKIDAFISKLESFNPSQTMGISCWAMGYRDKCDSVDVKSYIEDFSALIA